MKILFISSWYPSESNLNKGIFVKKHAACIKQAGNDLVILALSVNHSPNKLYQKKIFCFTDEAGIETHIIEINSMFYKWLHINLFFQYYLVSQYYKKNIQPDFYPDYIHSNVIYPAGIIGFLLSRKLKTKSVITEHWTRLDKFFHKSWYAGMGKKAYTHSRVTVVSSFLKNTLIRNGIGSDHITVIPNVIESCFFELPVKKTNELIFICCANWTSHKRPDLLFQSLEAYSKMTKKDIHLKVIGTGPLLDIQKKETWHFAVSYLGFLNSSEIAKAMSESNYFLHASNDETFSVVIAEALSSGLPVLASNVGAVPELIKPENGLLCENTLDAWIKGIDVLVNHKNYDPEAIRKSMERFLSGNIGRAFSNLYTSK